MYVKLNLSLLAIKGDYFKLPHVVGDECAHEQLCSGLGDAR